VTLTRSGPRVQIDVTDIPPASDESSEVWLAVTERGIMSEVPRGENAGRRLAHAPVVRVLRRIGVAQAGTFHGDTAIDPNPGWAPDALRIVVFVQRARTRQIVGANAT
jgi:hypothetical protein